MKKTIKTAELLDYLTKEIEASEAAAERYARELDVIDRGEYVGSRPIELERKRLNEHSIWCEHRIDALGTVKRHIYQMTKED